MKHHFASLRIVIIATLLSLTGSGERALGGGSEDVSALLKRFRSYDEVTYDEALGALRALPGEKLFPALTTWAEKLDDRDTLDRQRLESFRLMRKHGKFSELLLSKLVRSPNPWIRLELVPLIDSGVASRLEHLRPLAGDAHPDVRVRALEACFAIGTADSVFVAVEAAKRPMEKPIQKLLANGLMKLRSKWEPMVLKGTRLPYPNARGVDLLLSNLDEANAQKLEKSELVLTARIADPKLPRDKRYDFVAALADRHKRSVAEELFAQVGWIAGSEHEYGNVLTELTSMLDAEKEFLPAHRDALVTMTDEARPEIEQITGYRLLATVDGSFNNGWMTARQKLSTMLTLLKAVPIQPRAQIKSNLWTALIRIISEPDIMVVEKLDESSRRRFRRAGMKALASVPQFSRYAFTKLFKEISRDTFDAEYCASLLLAGEKAAWPSGTLFNDASMLTRRIRAMGTVDRHSDEFADLVELAKELASRIPSKSRRKAIQQIVAELHDLTVPKLNLPMSQGRMIYARSCAHCHGMDGAGVSDFVPRLSRTPWVVGTHERLTRLLMSGMTGRLVVGDTEYSGGSHTRPAPLTDADLVHVMNFIRNSFGNRAAPVTAEEVKPVREAADRRAAPWETSELIREFPLEN